jgi:hypothetical protein
MAKKMVTVNQAKLNKSGKEGVLTGGINLSPYTESLSHGGRNLCLWAGECATSCLKLAGMNQMTTHLKARIDKTLLWLNEPEVFLGQVKKEIEALLRKAARQTMDVAFRPNLLSDDYALATAVGGMFPDLQMYDYTKYPKPWERVSDNYHLTYSLDVGRGRERTALRCLDKGINVAVVFDLPKDAPMPKLWTLLGETYPMIDGDAHDLRYLDPKGVFVGLRGKRITGGSERAIENGFYRKAA